MAVWIFPFFVHDCDTKTNDVKQYEKCHDRQPNFPGKQICQPVSVFLVRDLYKQSVPTV